MPSLTHNCVAAHHAGFYRANTDAPEHAAATLVAWGLNVQHLDLVRPIREQVHIKQKTVRYTPTDKLYDAWIAILANTHGLVEVYTRMRSEPALQATFGHVLAPNNRSSRIRWTHARPRPTRKWNRRSRLPGTDQLTKALRPLVAAAD